MGSTQSSSGFIEGSDTRYKGERSGNAGVFRPRDTHNKINDGYGRITPAEPGEVVPSLRKDPDEEEVGRRCCLRSQITQWVAVRLQQRDNPC
jgi:hypothetical protein